MGVLLAGALLAPAQARPGVVPKPTLQLYPRISAETTSSEFTVQVSAGTGGWQPIDTYAVAVDLDDPSEASLAEFSMPNTSVQVKVTSLTGPIHSAVVEPASLKLNPSIGADGTTATFVLTRPTNLSFEVNGDRLQNLQLFANPIETQTPKRGSPHLIYFGAGAHLLPGNHVLSIPSDTTVYLAPGALVQGSLKVEGANDVVVRGDGIIQPYPYFTSDGDSAGVVVDRSSHVGIEDVTILRGQNGAVTLANSHDIAVSHVKEVTADRYSDGMDVSATSNVVVDHCFFRTSDDSIAVWATSPYDTKGGSSNLTVRDSVLWPDVAHGVLIGPFGQPGGTDVIKGVNFDNVDILNQNVDNPDYQGAIALDAGDSLTEEGIQFQNVRIAAVTLGQAVNIRVFLNPDYNTAPGTAIRDVLFRDVTVAAGNEGPSQIAGYSDSQTVSNVVFENFRSGGSVANGNGFAVGAYTSAVVFEPGQSLDVWNDDVSALRYSTGWSRAVEAGAYRSAVHRSTRAGATLTFRFSGREARLRGPLSPNGGLVDVYVDGVYARTIDTYSATGSERRVLFDSGVLAPGVHTVKVRLDGSHDALSGGTGVAIDSVEVVS